MAMIPHKRYDDATGNFVDCDGKMVDIGTLVAPNRFLCTKCRTTKVVEPGPVVEEVIGEEAPTDPAGRPGILSRIWKALRGS